MNSNTSLNTKALVMMVGPSAIGKSSLMNEMVRLHENFAYVRAFTTRAPRQGEQSHYMFIDQKEAVRLRGEGLAITYIEHPTTHDIYGTTIESYPATYNLLDTLSGSVEQYRNLPFKTTITLAITAPAEEWREWFTNRYPKPSPEAEKRLAEAALSIDWALNDQNVHWLVNEQDTLENTAKKAIAISLNPPTARNIPNEPYAMLAIIKRGIWSKP